MSFPLVPPLKTQDAPDLETNFDIENLYSEWFV